ncbi:MAG: acyl-CoA thioesterase [Ilumatobacteraceae bacterium]
MSYRHRIVVRYGECDMQRVVFNANYFAYCDDTVDSWMRSALAKELAAAGTSTDLHALGFDFMLKTATITWHAPIRFGETVQMEARVSRWGRSSFEVAIAGRVDDPAEAAVRFEAAITYVSVDPVGQRPAPVPEFVKSALGTPS